MKSGRVPNIVLMQGRCRECGGKGMCTATGICLSCAKPRVLKAALEGGADVRRGQGERKKGDGA